MSKCIIFSRVSTEKQEHGQIDNVVSLARSHGYWDEDMFIIEEKESGIKLSEEDRLGLNRVETLINSDNSIDSLFASEAVCLAKTKRVLFIKLVLLPTLSS